MSRKMTLSVVVLMTLIVPVAGSDTCKEWSGSAAPELANDPGPSSDPNGLRLANDPGPSSDPNGLRLANDPGPSSDPNGVRRA